MSKAGYLRFSARDACGCHAVAEATVDGAPVRVTMDGGSFCVMAINDDGAMISHPRIPDGLIVVSSVELDSLID